MLITPQNFPVLEWTSYRPGTEPENLNIAAVNQKGYFLGSTLEVAVCFSQQRSRQIPFRKGIQSHQARPFA